MTTLIGNAGYQHNERAAIGVLLVNLGTPDQPTAAAVRPYLRRFLSDARVVETSRPLWWLILRLVILPTRPARAAAAYAKIWQADGSPLLLISQRQRAALQAALDETFGAGKVKVALGMSYSKPFIADGLNELRRQNCGRIIVLPLYPQYASSTVGSVFSDVAAAISRWRHTPHLRFISGYADDPRYIAQLARSVRDYRARYGGAQKLVFSFHGTPLKMLTDGDPYHCLCRKTARLTAQALNLADDEWLVTFQSRFGRAVWLQPYTDETLAALPSRGVKNIHIISPAFAADCLETLEELAQENREIFIEAGGEGYGYIPALNDDAGHIHFLRDLLGDMLGDWLAALDRDNPMLQLAQYQLINDNKNNNDNSSAGNDNSNNTAG